MAINIVAFLKLVDTGCDVNLRSFLLFLKYKVMLLVATSDTHTLIHFDTLA